MAYTPGLGDMEVEVGPVASFSEGARSLIRAGPRNIAVYLHNGKFYAIDNACYHHGGPLHNGDIEDVGGHPCVICPWHSYRIALDTGEGLYIGLDLTAKKECVKTKGVKQRTHPVIIRDGRVIVQVQTGGSSIESDTYATMAIANQEQPTSKPSTATNNLRHIHSKGSGSFSDPQGAERDRARAELRSKHLDSAVKTLKTSDVPHLQCISRRFVSADKSVVQFTFDRVSGFEPKDALRPGMWVTLELPLSLQEAQSHLAEQMMGSSTTSSVVGGRRASGNSFTVQNASSLSGPQSTAPKENGPMPDTQLKRTYTVISATSNGRNRHSQGWFSIAVKNMASPTIPRSVKAALHAGGCGSRWLHERGHRGNVNGVGTIASPEVRLVESGGKFSIAMERTLISRKQGRVLLLTAGIGVTPVFASLSEMLQDDFARSSGPSLHMLHIHVDRTLAGIPFLPELLMYREEMKGTSIQTDPMSYHLALYATQQGSIEETRGELDFTQRSVGAIGDDSDNAFAVPSAPSMSEPLSPNALNRPQPVEDPLLKSFGHKRLETLRSSSEAVDTVLAGMAKDGMVHYNKRPSRSDVVEGCKQYLGTPTDYIAFICGPDAMITEWARVLEEAGVPPQGIITERFDF